jgi:hypothetical protein
MPEIQAIINDLIGQYSQSKLDEIFVRLGMNVSPNAFIRALEMREPKLRNEVRSALEDDRDADSPIPSKGDDSQFDMPESEGSDIVSKMMSADEIEDLTQPDFRIGHKA